jgi:nucleoside-diphosphate-sugar epimerase
MKIAITGGRGHIGRAVAELALAQGHEVVVIDRVEVDQPPHPNRSDVVADTTRFDQVKDALAGCDGLIHLAAHPNPDHQPGWTVHNDNVVGSYNALLAAAESGIEHVVMASSVNYYGMLYSSGGLQLHYLPLDEAHPSNTDDPYSLSKVVMEQQARSIARRHRGMGIAALRFHWVVAQRPVATVHEPERSSKQLWGYVTYESAARACLAAVTADFVGFEPFLIVADDTLLDTASSDAAARFYPEVPLTKQLAGNEGFFDCSKAEQWLGWRHSARPNRLKEETNDYEFQRNPS